ncbi:MAG: CDP-diacylglycerol--glycerol-3-phosphate 3-phosphatidyltransferase [Planctomycetota bacterium]|jgi:CDP-diacylglycerol--glycerol-3-phosphate 3-phosphatidyltransferase
MKKRFLTIPNALTLFRIASAPLFVLAWFASGGRGLSEAEQETRRQIGLWACLILTCLSEGSDFLDGWLARRWDQVSAFGKLMDPYADSIFRLAVLLCFASPPHGPWYPLWMPILLFWRDTGTSTIRLFGMGQGTVVAARFWGKAKAAAQATLIIALLVLALARDRLAFFTDPALRASAFWMMAIVVAIAWFGLITYIRAYSSMLRKGMTGEAQQSTKEQGSRQRSRTVASLPGERVRGAR